MKVVIIGAGNVATVLGRRIKQCGHEVLQVVSRKKDSAKILADELECPFTDNGGTMDRDAGLYLLAVSDDAMTGFDKSYHLDNKLVVHTAGSVSKDVLKDFSSSYGVMYPLQSLNKNISPQPLNIPLLIDANTGDALARLEEFAQTLSQNVSRANDQLRLNLHVAAVLVNNFTNHLHFLAADYCKHEGADFKLLLPLIEETALRLRYHMPNEMRTGPAVRKDIKTLQRHLRLLADYPSIHNIYLKMTDSIMQSVDEIL